MVAHSSGGYTAVPGEVRTMAGPPPSGRQGYGLPPAGTGSFVDLLPPVVKPVAALGAGLVRAAGPLLHLLAGLVQVAYRAIVISSPLLIWAGTKYITWQVVGALGKVEHLFKWGKWILGLLPKARPPPA